jgi:hypothetical protein
MLLTACLLLGVLTAEPQPGLPDGTSGHEMLTVPVATLSNRLDPQTVLLNLINDERSRAGLKPLTWDAKLAQAARDHAEVMSQEGRLSHQFAGEPALLERLTRRSVRLDAASENVVYDVTAEGAHEAFDKSTPHRINMLNASYDGVGIAVIDRDGVLYVVEDFAHRIFDQDDDAAAERIANNFAGVRQQSGLPPLELVNNARVHEFVEQMAERETPDSHAPLSLPGARYAASYATTSPNEIPATVARLASFRGAGTYTVGVRFARTAKYPSGLFWVSIVLFDGNTAVARN